MDCVVIFPNHLRMLRMQRGISQAALADQVGSCRTTIGNIERGIQEPSIRIACRIAVCLHCSLYEVFPFEEAKIVT